MKEKIDSIDDLFRQNDLANKITTMQTHVVDGAYLNQPGKLHVMLNTKDLKYSGRKISYEAAEEFARKYLVSPIENFELRIAQAIGDNYKKMPKAIKMIFEKRKDPDDNDASMNFSPAYFTGIQGRYV